MLWALWAARSALMLVYISGLVAMGFSPLVRDLERRPSHGRGRVPRPVAILAIYLTIVIVAIALGLMVVPTLVVQAGELWTALPQKFDELQRFLIGHRLMTHRVTLREAVQNAPAGAGGNAVTTVLGAIFSVLGGVFGLVTIVILSFYLLIEGDSLFTYLVRFVPARRRAAVSTAAREAVKKVSAWMRAQFLLAG